MPPPKPPPFADLESKRCFGHRTNTTAVAWNLPGDRLLSAGDASTILLYDTSRLQASVRPETHVLLQCRGHSKNIEAVVASTTSEHMFASAGVDCLINIFDARTGQRPIHTITADAKCLFADWAPDGSTLAVGDSANAVYFVDCLTWTVRRKLAFDAEVNQFRWDAANRLYFTRGDGSLHAYEWPVLRPLVSARAHTHACVGVAADPRHRRLAVAGLDACVTVWDAPSVSCLFAVDRWDRPVQGVEFSHCGTYIAVMSDYERIDIVEAATGSHAYSINTPGVLNNIAFHPTRFLLAYSPAKTHRYNADPTPATYVWGFPRAK